MPRSEHRVPELADFKVMVRNLQGKYLARDDHGLFFTDSRAGAMVFDFYADAVREQLEQIRVTHGLDLVEEPVPLQEVFESCDRCKELFMPYMTFFDGKRFLCADCRKLLSPGKRGL